MRVDRVAGAVVISGLLLAAARADDDVSNKPITVIAGSFVKHALMIPEFDLEPASGTAGQQPQACGLKLVESYHMQLDGEDHPVVPVLLDKPRLLIVDTGGVRSTLYSSVAKEMNLAPPEDDSVGEIGVAGDVTDKVVTVPEMNFGLVRFHRATFGLVADSRPLPPADNEIAGTLGPTHLMTFDNDFDFGHSRFNLFAPDHCPGKVVYWARDFVTVPFTLDGTHIRFAMTLDGKPVTATLDTGSPATFLNMDTAKELFGLEPSSSGVDQAGHVAGQNDDASRVFQHRFHSLSLDGIEVRDPLIYLLPDKVAERTLDRRHLDQLILGLREISQLHIYVAYKERVLYVTAWDATMPKTAPAAKGPPSGTH